jgi:hypothetical protein
MDPVNHCATLRNRGLLGKAIRLPQTAHEGRENNNSADASHKIPNYKKTTSTFRQNGQRIGFAPKNDRTATKIPKALVNRNSASGLELHEIAA